MKMMTIQSMPNRDRLYRAADILALITIFYNILEGAFSVGFGASDETFALFGFGLDSFVEVISGVGVWHMIRRIRLSGDNSPDAFERRALHVTGTAFYILAAGLILTGVLTLIQGHRPETTFWGIVIALISICSMWLLIHYKVKVGKALDSQAILADAANLRRLKIALKALQAERIAVPGLHLRYLHRGHAVHFRCHAREVAGLRIDVMSNLRGLPSFPTLWRRRSVVRVDPGGTSYDLMSLPDLVRAKKTQRDKDWPMIRRLIEADFRASSPAPKRIRFWLNAARTPGILKELARRHPEMARRAERDRPLLRDIADADDEDIARRLRVEEDRERAADRAYWEPLRRELETIRHGRRTPKKKDGTGAPP